MKQPPHAILASRLFQGLSPGEQAAVFEKALPRQLGPGQILERQGDPALTFYLVESGCLKLTQITPGGDEILVRFVEPGQPFGGVAVLERTTYPVSASAMESTRVLLWHRETMAMLADRYSHIKTALLETIAGHMTEALTRVQELTTQPVAQRIARALFRLSRQAGRPERDGILIAHPVTRQELAQMTGTTIYTVSRTLSQWESQGILKTGRRRILIRQPRRLEHLADEGDESVPT